MTSQRRRRRSRVAASSTSPANVSNAPWRTAVRSSSSRRGNYTRCAMIARSRGDGPLASERHHSTDGRRL
eukprot:1834553-Pyramimonas_sp.AAC.1